MTHDTIVALAVLGVAGQLIAVVLSSSSPRPASVFPRPLGWCGRRCGGMSCGRRSWFRRSRRAAASSSPRSRDSSPASSAGTSGSACIRSRSSPCSLRSLATSESLATCCRCRSSAPASPSTTCWSRTASLVRARACLVSAPGGCATKWINEFGYMTIPTLALTAFVLLIELLGFAAIGKRRRPELPWALMPSGKASKRRRTTPVAPPPVRSEGRAAAAPGVSARADRRPARRRRGRSRDRPGGRAWRRIVELARRTCPPSVRSPAGLPRASDVNTLFKGIPQSGTTLGRSTAPVTMDEFIDPQCPYCQEFETLGAAVASSRTTSGRAS